jgi:hypothetical protein
VAHTGATVATGVQPKEQEAPINMPKNILYFLASEVAANVRANLAAVQHTSNHFI